MMFAYRKDLRSYPVCIINRLAAGLSGMMMLPSMLQGPHSSSAHVPVAAGQEVTGSKFALHMAVRNPYQP